MRPPRDAAAPLPRSAKVVIAVLATIGFAGLPALVVAGIVVRRSAGPGAVACGGTPPVASPSSAVSPAPAVPAPAELRLVTSCGDVLVTLSATLPAGAWAGGGCERLAARSFAAVRCGPGAATPALADPGGTARRISAGDVALVDGRLVLVVRGEAEAAGDPLGRVTGGTGVLGRLERELAAGRRAYLLAATATR